jgi:hypothetical protein
MSTVLDARGRRRQVGYNTISILILRNGHGVLAGRAEARKDDRNPNHFSRQKHRLQGAWLVASDRTGIPQVYGFGFNGHIRRGKLP